MFAVLRINLICVKSVMSLVEFDDARRRKNMHRHSISISVAVAVLTTPATALTMSDSLAAWREGSAMDRIQLATRFGKSFVALNEGFTADYFLKCIDDVSTYGKAKDARIEDAMRECVAARLRQPGDGDE